MKEEIKKYPFCGSKAEIHTPKQIVGVKNDSWFVVKCTDSKCLGRNNKRFYSREEAIEAWNRRV